MHILNKFNYKVKKRWQHSYYPWWQHFIFILVYNMLFLFFTTNNFKFLICRIDTLFAFSFSYIFCFFYMIRCLDKKNIYFNPSNSSTEYCKESVLMYDHPTIDKRASNCCDDSDFCNERLALTLSLSLPPG